MPRMAGRDVASCGALDEPGKIDHERELRNPRRRQPGSVRHSFLAVGDSGILKVPKPLLAATREAFSESRRDPYGIPAPIEAGRAVRAAPRRVTSLPFMPRLPPDRADCLCELTALGADTVTHHRRGKVAKSG